MLSHSYSSIKDFQGCPKRYHEVRILKRFKSGDTDATRYGTEVHSAFEHRVRDKTPLPPAHSRFEPYAKVVADAAAQDGIELFCEHRMAITADFKPCEFFAKDVWFRGIPDALLVDRARGVARVVDYKTGKSSRYADTSQLQLLAAMVFAHFPEVQIVRGILMFVVAGDAVPADFTRAEMAGILSTWAGYADDVEQALANNVWNPRPSALCRFCPVSSCPNFPK